MPPSDSAISPTSLSMSGSNSPLWSTSAYTSKMAPDSVFSGKSASTLVVSTVPRMIWFSMVISMVCPSSVISTGKVSSLSTKASGAAISRMTQLPTGTRSNSKYPMGLLSVTMRAVSSVNSVSSKRNRPITAPPNSNPSWSTFQPDTLPYFSVFSMASPSLTSSCTVATSCPAYSNTTGYFSSLNR